jgi:hypothetical protein
MQIQDNVTATERLFPPNFYCYYFHFILFCIVLLTEIENTYERFEVLMAGIKTITVF